MNRREFSRLMFMASASAALSSCRFDLSSTPSESILIVGAGMAGISAARNLHDAGYKVKILEGRNRVGGRVWTSRRWAETPVDLGASWIHGVRRNPLTRLADEIDAARLETDYDNAIVYNTDGDLQADRIWNDLGEIERRVTRAIAQASDMDEDVSIEEAIADSLDLSSLSETERRYVDFMANSNIELAWAADIGELSAHHLQEGAAFGGNDVIFPNGYDQLIDYLAAGLDISLNETVTQIDYDGARVRVSATSGVFEANRVIVTLPIGVLQRGDVMFNPPLPTEKREAISAIGIGVLNKVYLQFAEPFWQRQPEWISYISESKGEFSAWLNYYHYIDAPILLAFNAGVFGKEIETFSDDLIVAQAMQTLRLMYGASAVDPLDVQITRWHNDPFAYCSYSAPVVGMTARSRSEMAEPVADRLFFAGEATHSDYPATVHGAYLSGQREAERIKQQASR